MCAGNSPRGGYPVPDVGVTPWWPFTAIVDCHYLSARCAKRGTNSPRGEFDQWGVRGDPQGGGIRPRRRFPGDFLRDGSFLEVRTGVT